MKLSYFTKLSHFTHVSIGLTGSPWLKRGRKAGAGGGEGAKLRLGRWAAHFGVADGRRSGRGGAGRRSTAVRQPLERQPRPNDQAQ